MKIIFLDFDGVLNSQGSLKRKNDNRLFYGKRSTLSYDLLARWIMSYFDYEKILFLKTVCNYTGAVVIPIGAHVDYIYWPLIEERFVEFGIPILDARPRDISRGTFIRQYVSDNGISTYAVLDDDRFRDYDEEILDHMFKTSFYDEGLDWDTTLEVISFLGTYEKTL